MSQIVNELVSEYTVLRESLDKLIENLSEEKSKRIVDPNTLQNIEKSFSILDCSLDQTDKTFYLARNDGNVSILKKMIENNFKPERKIIQTIAKTVYNISATQGLRIAYDSWRNHINDKLLELHNIFEDIVVRRNDSTMNSDCRQVYLGFDYHQKEALHHDALFEEAIRNEDLRSMAESIAMDIPDELKILNGIEKKINRLSNLR
ncbi:hypothetical protein HA402_010999 [Bradysia odoriphaga]|nr:hypothetical protein HA402_010999 [Bradysia odoriphaga]